MEFKTEEEKMINGQWYDSTSMELIEKLSNARKIEYEFNNIVGDTKEGMKVFRKLTPNTGEGVIVIPPFICDFGNHIEIGDKTFINKGCTFLDCGKITIGKNCFIGPSTHILTPVHPLDYKSRNKGHLMARPVEIGDNVWIGGNVTILPGVKIGSGSVIGAGSVVTKNIPENSKAAGNPCRVLGKIDND